MVNRSREQGPKEPSQGHGYAGGCKAGPRPCTLPPAGTQDRPLPPPIPAGSQLLPCVLHSTLHSIQCKPFKAAVRWRPALCTLHSPSLSCSHSACALATPAIFTLH